MDADAAEGPSRATTTRRTGCCSRSMTPAMETRSISRPRARKASNPACRIEELVAPPADARAKPAGCSRASSPGAVKAAMPAPIELQLASPGADPPGDEGWLHEIKFDGYRTLAHVLKARRRVSSRAAGSTGPGATATCPRRSPAGREAGGDRRRSRRARRKRASAVSPRCRMRWRRAPAQARLLRLRPAASQWLGPARRAAAEAQGAAGATAGGPRSAAARPSSSATTSRATAAAL